MRTATQEVTRVGKSSAQMPVVRPSLILPVAGEFSPKPLEPERVDAGAQGALDWWTGGRPGQSGEDSLLADDEGLF